MGPGERTFIFDAFIYYLSWCSILIQVKENGATEVVDYTKGDVVEHFTRQEEGETKKFDIVYDSATNSGGGEDYREKSLKLLKQDDPNHGKF